MKEMKDRFSNFTLPKWNEIPDVGLYLDQVTKYINGYFGDFKDMMVTPSMISNYVKLKIVSKPEKKTYSREQIAYFIFIVLSKTVLSMDHIKQVFLIQKESYSSEKAYTYFQEELLKALENLFEEKKEIHKKNLSDEHQMVQHIVTAIAHQMYLEKYFEE
ncbi:MAG: DUF1836 domain-containing protein [Solobacterium sp.]|nr:DUF1836 domain-containing protein [Solobacterium sp.]